MGETTTVFGEQRLQETGENVSNQKNSPVNQNALQKTELKISLRNEQQVIVEVLNQLNHNAGRNIQYFQHVGGL